MLEMRGNELVMPVLRVDGNRLLGMVVDVWGGARARRKSQYVAG